jgi:hypothetical protein
VNGLRAGSEPLNQATNIRRYLQLDGPNRNRRVRGSQGLGELIRYALLEDEATSFVRNPGCSIESPLIHQSKSNAVAGIGCEWLGRGGETCLCLCLSLSQPGQMREATRTTLAVGSQLPLGEVLRVKLKPLRLGHRGTWLVVGQHVAPRRFTSAWGGARPNSMEQSCHDRPAFEPSSGTVSHNR